MIRRFFLACCKTTITRVYDKQHSLSEGKRMGEYINGMTKKAKIPGESMFNTSDMGHAGMLISQSAVA
jgi:hypothetical protein